MKLRIFLKKTMENFSLIKILNGGKMSKITYLKLLNIKSSLIREDMVKC